MCDFYLSIHDLTPSERNVYKTMVEEEDILPHIGEYPLNGYPEYCRDIKHIISKYVDRAGLGYESIGRIFEVYFMYRCL